MTKFLLLFLALPIFGQKMVSCQDLAFGHIRGKASVSTVKMSNHETRTVFKITPSDRNIAPVVGYVMSTTEIVTEGKVATETALRDLEGKMIALEVRLLIPKGKCHVSMDRLGIYTKVDIKAIETEVKPGN